MDGVREVGAVTKRGSVRTGLHLRRATVNDTRRLPLDHWLNIELDLRSLFGLHVHSRTHWLRPRNASHPPRIWAHVRGRYWSAKIDDITV